MAKREADFRLNLVKDEPMIRDARWEIAITNLGDFGYGGKLCVRHRERGALDQWPQRESDDPSPVAARCYDLEYEVTFPTLGKAKAAARDFLRRWGAGEIEMLEWDIDGQRYVVVEHAARGTGLFFEWKDQPDPVPPASAPGA